MQVCKGFVVYTAILFSINRSKYLCIICTNIYKAHIVSEFTNIGLEQGTFQDSWDSSIGLEEFLL